MKKSSKKPNKEEPGGGKDTRGSETRKKILAAAHQEFTQVGLAGARVDRIVERAGVNKKMLYHHFASKEVLFREILYRGLAEMSEAEAKSPDDLAEDLIYWRDLIIRNPDWIRLSLWEALNFGPTDIIGEEARREFWKKGVAHIRREQKCGMISNQFDPALVQLFQIALTIFPLLLPHLTELITGRGPKDPVFLHRQSIFLKQMANVLQNSGSG